MRMAPQTDTRAIPNSKLPVARVGADSLPLKLEPWSFMRKAKNELGLHDVSAVLLKPTLRLSAQNFSKLGSIAVFAPIPLEEDMVLFEELSAAAKRQKESELYIFVQVARARFTRLQYGSAGDMAVTYQVEMRDGKEHVRYGRATKVGQGGHPLPVKAEVLDARRYDAMHYKTRIVLAAVTDANNEVTIKYREHAGDFPWIGNPDGKNGWIVGKTRQSGIVTDDGTFYPNR